MKKPDQARKPYRWKAYPATGLPPERRAVIDRAIAHAHLVGKDFPLPKHPGLNERGFGYVELAIVVALLAALAGFGRWMYALGEGAKQSEWDTSELARAAHERDRNKAVGVALLLAEKARIAAEDKAHEHENLWKEERRENRRTGKSLGSCEEPRPDPAPPAGAGDLARGDSGAGVRAPGVAGRPGVLLHWRFVGMYDGAHSAGRIHGEPIFGATAEYALAPERADTASPYTLDDVLDVHGENAFEWGKCRRDLNAAIDLVEAAEAAYERGKR